MPSPHSPADTRVEGLLDFEEVRRRLRLGPGIDAGRQEIAVRQVIGTVGRAHDFDRMFRPRNQRLAKMVSEIGASNPAFADQAIKVNEVDQAYFVVDGHKRVSLAKAHGRLFIDADVTRFSSRFQVDRETTIDAVRSTEEEVRFREETGLLQAVPDARFPLGDPDGYLDLKESVKAHAYDLSVQRGQLIPAAEAAKHWHDVVFQKAVAIAHDAGYDQMLSGCSDAELFLIIRRGNRDRFDPGWEISSALTDRSLRNLRAAAPSKLASPLNRLLPRRRPRAKVLPQKPKAGKREPGTPEP
jgi:hypothetical protein